MRNGAQPLHRRGEEDAGQIVEGAPFGLEERPASAGLEALASSEAILNPPTVLPSW